MPDFKHELLDDRVVLQPDPLIEKTEGGLYQPKSAVQLSDKATVVAVGKGAIAPDTGELIPMFLKAGDRVIFDKFQVENFEGFLLTRQANIKCIINDK